MFWIKAELLFMKKRKGTAFPFFRICFKNQNICCCFEPTRIGETTKKPNMDLAALF